MVGSLVACLAAIVASGSASLTYTHSVIKCTDCPHGVALKDDVEAGAIATGMYQKTFNSTGWDFFAVETTKTFDDELQAFAAGYLEGALTWRAMLDNIRDLSIPSPKDDDLTIYNFTVMWFNTNVAFVDRMVESEKAVDPFWFQIALLQQQARGMFAGFLSIPEVQAEELTEAQLWAFAAQAEYVDTLPRKKWNATAGIDVDEIYKRMRCTAVVKVLPESEDLLMGHATWDDYIAMVRMYKVYRMNFNHPSVRASVMSFSSYPGTLFSSDDMYIISNGLSVMESEIPVWPWARDNFPGVFPPPSGEGFVLAWYRTLAANRIAVDAQDWGKHIARYNSGTFNAAWMVVDTSKFTAGQPLQPDTLWLHEQMPGNVTSADITQWLVNTSFWPSYCIAYFPNIRTGLGFDTAQFYPLMSTQEFFNTNRYLMYDKLTQQVKNIHDLALVMRYNDITDPDAIRPDTHNATYAYGIAPRTDLEKGTGQRRAQAFGALDAKVWSAATMSNTDVLQVIAQSGPTTYGNLPPFNWTAWEAVNPGNPFAPSGQPLVYDFPWINFTINVDPEVIPESDWPRSGKL